MKICNVGDLHADAVTAGVSRFDEVERALSRSLGWAKENMRDGGLYVFTGDLCDPDSGPVVFRAVRMVLEAAVQLADWGIDSLWVAGNHDCILDGRGHTTLEPLRALAGKTRKAGVFVAEGPMVFPYVGRIGKPWLVVALPYPGAFPYDPAEVLLGAHADRPKDSELLVFGHLVVPGLQQGEEAHEMSRGKEVFFPVELLPQVGPKLVCNGHHHARQVTPHGIHIPGSVANFRFGPEESNQPGFLTFEL
jgi:DNA repair exonuclease SbcCD nuclease subunit